MSDIDASAYYECTNSGLLRLGDTLTQWELRRNGRLFGCPNETEVVGLRNRELSLKTGDDAKAGTRRGECNR